jgi:hypothetical protein
VNIRNINGFVGESLPVRYSFLSLLKSFAGQTLTGASIAWTSQTPALATFDLASGALVTSDQGSADGIPNDACLGRFTLVSAGICTVKVSVSAVNPTATYVGVVQINISPIPSP